MKFCPQCGSDLLLHDEEKPYRTDCSKCGHIEYHNPAPAVAAIVNLSGKLLLVQYKDRPNLWGLPGGFVENGENLEHALTRELKEETDLTIRITGYLNSYYTTRHDKGVIFIVFSAEADEGEIKVSEELLQVVSLSPQQAYEKATGTYSKQAIGQWLQER
ncbi:MAG: NUDIX domain-containing protein [Candidatus Thorarchaeota archaeon]